MNVSPADLRNSFFYRCNHQRRTCLHVAARALLVVVLLAPQLAVAAYTTVHMITSLGAIDIKLYDDDQLPDQAPITVANFLRYAGRGDYNGTVIHRSVLNFIIQGGGHVCASFGRLICFHIQTDAPILNEFSPTRSNVRGTIAMAKIGGNPNSATSEWFFNLADNNSANLDSQNGGFTVFGCVLDTASGTCTGSGSGMNVVDTIAALPIFDGANNYPFYYPCNPDQNNNCTNPTYFDHLPTYNYNPSAYNVNDQATYLQTSNLVTVNDIPNVTATKTATTGTTSAYAADVDVTLSNPDSNKTVDAVTSASWLQTFTPPPGKIVQFNDEISRFTMTWTTGSTTRVVTLYHGANANVNGYYAYGPTSDNLTPHWYDFTYDGVTGAEFVGNKILLHFVDNQRGDDDPTAGTITHTGAPVLITDIPSSSASGSSGCSIASRPTSITSSGDWILVSMFLGFVALVRRRAGRDRIQRATKMEYPRP